MFTSAHIASIINNLATVLDRHQRNDPLQLAPRFAETEEQVVGGIRSLPQAAGRLFADALNQVRNSIEHVLSCPPKCRTHSVARITECDDEISAKAIRNRLAVSISTAFETPTLIEVNDDLRITPRAL